MPISGNRSTSQIAFPASPFLSAMKTVGNEIAFQKIAKSQIVRFDTPESSGMTPVAHFLFHRHGSSGTCRCAVDVYLPARIAATPSAMIAPPTHMNSRPTKIPTHAFGSGLLLLKVAMNRSNPMPAKADPNGMSTHPADPNDPDGDRDVDPDVDPDGDCCCMMTIPEMPAIVRSFKIADMLAARRRRTYTLQRC